MDLDNELDLVEQAERTAFEEPDHDQNDEPQEVQREVNDDGVEEVEADEAEEDENVQQRVIKPKRVVKNPQPKLNADTLRGPRGLTALPALFAKQTFKGKGHEEQDLNVLLKTYEYWCHRLYPKMVFKQCVEKIETLGSKKPVMTYVKRIRMGLLDDEPPEQREHVSDDETGAAEPTPQEQQQIETVESRFDSFAQRQIQQTQELQELTEEQKETIRINKEKALRLRQERLCKIQEQAETKLQTSSVLPSSASTSYISIEDSTIIDSSIQDKTTQLVGGEDSKTGSQDLVQQKETGKENLEAAPSTNIADFDDDEDFSALCSQIPMEDGQSQDFFANTQDNSQSHGLEEPEGVGVDDYLSFLQSGEEDYEAWKVKQSEPESNANKADDELLISTKVDSDHIIDDTAIEVDGEGSDVIESTKNDTHEAHTPNEIEIGLN